MADRRGGYISASVKPETLKNINHLGRRGVLNEKSSDVSYLTAHGGLAHGTGMNGLLAICGICREIIS